MSVVKINAITVPRERFDEFERRFATRAGRVSSAAGLEAFELLRPNDEREVCLVVTRWRSEEDFQAWVAGPERPRPAPGCWSARRAGSRSRPPAGACTSTPARCSTGRRVADVMVGLKRSGAVVRLAASHSASEAFVARMLRSRARTSS